MFRLRYNFRRRFGLAALFFSLICALPVFATSASWNMNGSFFFATGGFDASDPTQQIWHTVSTGVGGSTPPAFTLTTFTAPGYAFSGSITGPVYNLGGVQSVQWYVDNPGAWNFHWRAYSAANANSAPITTPSVRTTAPMVWSNPSQTLTLVWYIYKDGSTTPFKTITLGPGESQTLEFQRDAAETDDWNATAVWQDASFDTNGNVVSNPGHTASETTQLFPNSYFTNMTAPSITSTPGTSLQPQATVPVDATTGQTGAVAGVTAKAAPVVQNILWSSSTTPTNALDVQTFKEGVNAITNQIATSGGSSDSAALTEANSHLTNIDSNTAGLGGAFAAVAGYGPGDAAAGVAGAQSSAAGYGYPGPTADTPQSSFGGGGSLTGVDVPLGFMTQHLGFDTLTSGFPSGGDTILRAGRTLILWAMVVAFIWSCSSTVDAYVIGLSSASSSGVNTGIENAVPGVDALKQLAMSAAIVVGYTVAFAAFVGVVNTFAGDFGFSVSSLHAPSFSVIGPVWAFLDSYFPLNAFLELAVARALFSYMLLPAFWTADVIKTFMHL